MPPSIYPRQILRQMIDIGYYSLPVVGLTAIFTGMVLALQSYTGFARFSGRKRHPQCRRHLAHPRTGSVLAGLMVAGRIGAAMAAEIGTMRVTEQIDALVTLSTNPFKYLVAPRLIAAVLMLPVLVRHRRHHRRVRRLSGRRLQARLQRGGLSQEHGRLPRNQDVTRAS
jgi:phospholipid/cholesterol/gamma-HCH transport system permease protein